MDPQVDAPLLWDIYEEHLDEAEFFWTRWEHALTSPRYQLWELLALEEQLLARLDALVLGGIPVQEQLLAPTLEAQVPARVSTAAFALLSSDSPRASDAVLSCLRATLPIPLVAIPRALELVGRETLLPWVRQLLDTCIPRLQGVALALPISSDVVSHGALAEFIAHVDPQVSAAALRALARSGAPIDPGKLPLLLDSPHWEVREAALEAGLIGGHRATWEACMAAISTPEGRLNRLLVAMVGDENHLGSLRALLDNPLLRRDALWALGFSGRVSSADACIELMRDKVVAALAAEAFCAITGLPLEGPYVAERSSSPEEPVPLSEEALDTSLVPCAEEELPLPNVSAVSQWWAENRPRLDPGQRYLGGQVIGPEVILDALQQGPLRRRHALALEVLLRSRGKVNIPTRAFARQQVSVLRAVSTTFSKMPWPRKWPLS